MFEVFIKNLENRSWSDSTVGKALAKHETNQDSVTANPHMLPGTSQKSQEYALNTVDYTSEPKTRRERVNFQQQKSHYLKKSREYIGKILFIFLFCLVFKLAIFWYRIKITISLLKDSFQMSVFEPKTPFVKLSRTEKILHLKL